MSRPLPRAIRAALASGRVRTLSTAQALLDRGWIARLPLPLEHRDTLGEAYEALDWTPEGTAQRSRIKPLPPTPPEVVELLRGGR